MKNVIETAMKPGRRSARRSHRSRSNAQAREERKNQEVHACSRKDPKPEAERANKKAEAIAMMKRAKGATLAEIMSASK